MQEFRIQGYPLFRLYRSHLGHLRTGREGCRAGHGRARGVSDEQHQSGCWKQATPSRNPSRDWAYFVVLAPNNQVCSCCRYRALESSGFAARDILGHPTLSVSVSSLSPSGNRSE